jgi:hypothetical protein
MGMLHRMLCTAVVGTAAAFWSAPGAALPIATRVQALAGDGIIDGAASSRHYHGRVGQRRHREAYTRRHGNHAGPAIAGAALGIIGGALTAATAPRYGYHNQPASEAYPVYAPDPDYGYYSAPVYSETAMATAMAMVAGTRAGITVAMEEAGTTATPACCPASQDRSISPEPPRARTRHIG